MILLNNFLDMPKAKSQLYTYICISSGHRRQIRFRRNETVAEHAIRLENSRFREMQRRHMAIHSKSAFNYRPDLNYMEHSFMGRMSEICVFCKARKWPNETPGMCCSKGHVKLNDIGEPPPTVKALLTGEHMLSNHFKQNIRKYNGCFAMTSFGGNEIREGNFMPTFKIHGQVYHIIGSLLPPSNMVPKFLQIYFSSEEEQLSLRQNAAPTQRSGVTK